MSNVSDIAGERLKSFIERIERLEEEIRSLNEDKSEVFKEAKSIGFDVKVMKIIIKERRMDKDALDEQEALIDVYKRAIGMRPDFEDGTSVATRVQVREDAE